MIDLAPNIRAFIIADSTLTNSLSTYKSEKAVFTRRPVPPDAEYPMIVISSPIAQTESDYLDRLYRGTTYDIAVYGLNDTPANYVKCEEIAFLLQDKFARISNYEFTMPTGYHLSQAVATGPTPFPTDDENQVARGVTVTFNILKETA